MLAVQYMLCAMSLRKCSLAFTVLLCNEQVLTVIFVTLRHAEEHA